MSMDQVLNDAKTLEKSYRAVLAIVTKMEEIGDLDKAYEAAEKRLREHKQAVATAENKMNDAKDRLEGVYDEVAAAKAKAEGHVAIAIEQAKIVLADASHEVAEMNSEAKVILGRARTEVDTHNKHIYMQGEKHKARMEKNDAEYAASAESLAVLNGELAALRERIG